MVELALICGAKRIVRRNSFAFRLTAAGRHVREVANTRGKSPSRLGRVTKVEAKRRFGRAGARELSIDSVRLTDGRTIPLRATSEKGEGDMSGARVAATIAASPVLVWVKGKDVTFEKG